MGGHHLKNFQPHCILQPAAGWRGNKSWPFATALIGRFRLYALHAVKSKKSQWTRKTSHACFSRIFFLRPCCPFRLPSSISLPILFFPLLFLNLFIFFGWVMCTSQDQREHIRACLDGRRCVVVEHYASKLLYGWLLGQVPAWCTHIRIYTNHAAADRWWTVQVESHLIWSIYSVRGGRPLIDSCHVLFVSL